MSEQFLIGILIGLLVVQQFFYLMQIHKLLNKLMSRNYFDYEKSKPQDVIKVKMPTAQEPLEDFGVLKGFELT